MIVWGGIFPVVGAVVGYFLGVGLVRLIGLGYRDVQVGRLGDQPIYEKRDSYLSILLGVAGLVIGALAGGVLLVRNFQEG